MLPGAVVGPDCVIEGSVVMADAVVGAATRVRMSAIGHGAHVAEEVVVDHAVVGADARIGSGNELRQGARVSAGLDLPPDSLHF